MAEHFMTAATATTDPRLPELRQIYAKLPAQDIDRARSFYSEKLGLDPFGEHSRHLHYEVGGGYFVIFPSRGAPSGDHDQLGFVVDDIEQTVCAFEAKGVVFESVEPPTGDSLQDAIVDFGDLRAAWFKDSEGNLVSIAEFSARSPFSRKE